METATGSLAQKQKSGHGLQKRIQEIHDHLFANANIRTPSGLFRELSKVIFSAAYVEQSGGHLGGEPGEPESCQRVFEGVQQAYEALLAAWGWPESEGIQLDPHSVAFAVEKLSGLSFLHSGRDLLGDTIELLRSRWVKSAGGQFFTDPSAAGLALSLLDFQPGRGDTLIDLCAGTGSFLLAGLQRLEQAREEGWEGEARERLFGREIDEEVCAIANRTFSARLGGTYTRLVECSDSLRDALEHGSYDCAATNPPFGARITVKDEELLGRFELAQMSNGTLEPRRKPAPRSLELLFVEQNVRVVKPGSGRVAMVLPYQILSGPQTRYVRHWLLRHCQILAVVDLPIETFLPHTGTKTSLLLLRRRSRPLERPEDIEDLEQIFMASPQWIGHDRRGNPVYKRDAPHEILCDLPEVARDYASYVCGEAARFGLSFAVEARAVVEDPQLRLNARFHEHPSLHRDCEDWQWVAIAQLVERIFCPGRFKREYVADDCPGAVPFLGGTNVTQLLPTTDKYLHPDDPKLKKVQVEPGWILVTRSGSTGLVSSVPEAWGGYAISEHVIRIVPDAAQLSPGYLQAMLRSARGQRQLARGVFGSVIDEITPEHIGRIEIPVPKSPKARSEVAEIEAAMSRYESQRQAAIEAMAAAREALEGLACFGRPGEAS